ncbi:MAG: hypothetical protein PHG06_21195 [Parabacteroides sp.]|nr:hypothetical protein [Parabacteroides sp.]
MRACNGLPPTNIISSRIYINLSCGILKFSKRISPLILLICIVLTGCSSPSLRQPQQATRNSETTRIATEAELSFSGYKKIEVDGGDFSGCREANVVVDIGFGDREYWAFTNEHGQLIRVVADKIINQDDTAESVLSDGRYYNGEANVPGTERPDMDKGHVIADSLGGVSNAYNITPQESTLNRHGDQAYMEKVIRDAGGCSDFEAVITYPDTTTQIPSHYHYTYTINGNVITEDFDNVNPDEVNNQKSNANQNPSPQNGHDISSIDKNRDGQVTIKEAKAAGYKMPITKDHWLYQYMDDGDGDGAVGE